MEDSCLANNNCLACSGYVRNFLGSVRNTVAVLVAVIVSCLAEVYGTVPAQLNLHVQDMSDIF